MTWQRADVVDIDRHSSPRVTPRERNTQKPEIDIASKDPIMYPRFTVR